ncbi:hypothetical protein XENOCAPTIV_016864 [Xenoophorus captivus]|uniref:PH domain-containing protein n=1 Tax=Xenoophorus captivus TaxID=1517983 RepID=A0ABV0SFQ8_9TELE
MISKLYEAVLIATCFIVRNWKMRWFVLRDSKLMYYENDSEEKLKGTIDIRAAKEIVDNHEKENALNIVTDERTNL